MCVFQKLRRVTEEKQENACQYHQIGEIEIKTHARRGEVIDDRAVAYAVAHIGKRAREDEEERGRARRLALHCAHGGDAYHRERDGECDPRVAMQYKHTARNGAGGVKAIAFKSRSSASSASGNGSARKA